MDYQLLCDHLELMDAEKWSHFQTTAVGFTSTVSRNQVESGNVDTSMGGGHSLLNVNASSELPCHTKVVLVLCG